MAEGEVKLSQFPNRDAADLTDDAIIEVVDDNINFKTTLKELGGFILPFYAKAKVTNVTVIDDTYQEIARLEVTEAQPAGTYRPQFDISYTLDSTTNSAFLRFSIDGGLTWTEFSSEPKDKTDTRPISYGFPKDFPAQIYDIRIEARKELTSTVMVIEFCDISLERKA